MSYDQNILKSNELGEYLLVLSVSFPNEGMIVVDNVYIYLNG